MIHDPEFISIVRTRRRIFIGLFVAAAVVSVGIAVYKVKYDRLKFPNNQRYADVLKLLQKTAITTQSGAYELLLEVADTPDKRTQGLMFRQSLAINSGMLFVFDRDTTNPFWMKNTRLSLDILFIGTDGRIVDFLTMKPCKDGEECTRYFSTRPYRYAIEVNKGFIEEKRVQIGDMVAFQNP